MQKSKYKLNALLWESRCDDSALTTMVFLFLGYIYNFDIRGFQ